MVMKCTKCGSRNLVLVTSGPHNKLVCGDCLAFQKFLSEADASTFRQMQQNPTRLSDVDEFKAKILRLTTEADEFTLSVPQNSRTISFLSLYDIIVDIKNLCK